MEHSTDCLYEALNPRAEADPVVGRPLSPRLGSLESKNIGLFANFKKAAEPIQAEVERKLSEKFPSASFKFYKSNQEIGSELEGENREGFTDWLREVDGVILAIGD